MTACVVLVFEPVSPAVRGRGLKQLDCMDGNEHIRSPAVRGRGLKLLLGEESLRSQEVARRTRAWIETLRWRHLSRNGYVARRTRAWIETRPITAS